MGLSSSKNASHGALQQHNVNSDLLRPIKELRGEREMSTNRSRGDRSQGSRLGDGSYSKDFYNSSAYGMAKN